MGNQDYWTCPSRWYVSWLRLTRLFILLIVVFPATVSAQETHYTIDGKGSDMRLLVYKQGVMKWLGHNHVISSSAIGGKIIHNTEEWEKSHFRLRFSVRQFVVDRFLDRQRSGPAFHNKIDDEIALSTRRNMLSQQQLDAQQYPDILVSGKISSNNRALTNIVISLKGRQKKISVPLSLLITDKVLTASGRFSIMQTDFGIQPMSLFGGLLAVRDQVEVVFNIKAEKE